MKLDALSQWWQMQRKNKLQLEQMLSETIDNPDIQKRISEQWWEMHRENKISLDETWRKAGENPEL